MKELIYFFLEYSFNLFCLTDVEYQYNKAGQVSWMKDAQGESTSYKYDPAGRLQEVINKKIRSAYEYDNAGNLAWRHDNNGLDVSYNYTPLNLVKDIIIKRRDDNTENLNKHYEYNLNGSRITEVDNLKNKTHKYTYDALDQLTGVDYEWTDGAIVKDLEYNYDAVGNRTFYKDKFKTHNYHYAEDSNKLLYYTINGTSDKNRIDFEYDANGNMTKKTRKQNDKIREQSVFKYDFDNRMTDFEKYKPKVNDPSEMIKIKQSEYKYDWLGRREEKRVDGVMKRYLYSGQRVINETGTDGNINKSFIFGLGKLGSLDNVTLKKDNEDIVLKQAHFNYQDPLGSISISADIKGNVIEQNEYDPFGNVLSSVYNNNKKNNYKFTGKEFDQESGLYYYGARYYDPKVGRFTTLDPIREGINHYVYTINNPLKYVDLWGLSIDENVVDPESGVIWQKSKNSVTINDITIHGADMPLNDMQTPTSEIEDPEKIRNLDKAEVMIGFKDNVAGEVLSDIDSKDEMDSLETEFDNDKFEDSMSDLIPRTVNVPIDIKEELEKVEQSIESISVSIGKINKMNLAKALNRQRYASGYGSEKLTIRWEYAEMDISRSKFKIESPMDIRTDWTKGFKRNIKGQNKYNKYILKYSKQYKIDPYLLKSLIAEESGFDPKARNKGGHAGLTQLSTPNAKWAPMISIGKTRYKKIPMLKKAWEGLKGLFSKKSKTKPKKRKGYYIFDMKGDERFNPKKSIEAGAWLYKKQREQAENLFKQYGSPENELEKTKFYLAIYNLGITAVKKAVKEKYSGNKNILKWDDLITESTKLKDIKDSPLYKAIPAYMDKKEKYDEVTNYVENIIKRKNQPDPVLKKILEQLEKKEE